MERRGTTATAVGGLTAAGGVVAALLHVLSDIRVPDGTTDFTPTSAVVAVAFGVTGAAVLRARARHPVGRLLVAMSLGHAVTALSRELGVRLVAQDRPAAAAWLLWVGSWAWMVTFWFPLLLMLLPDGRPISPRWRTPIRLALALPLPLVIVAALSPDPLLLQPVRGRALPANPIGGVALPPIELLSFLGFVVLALVAVVGLARRFRAGGVAREQLKWVLLAGGSVAFAIPLDVAFPSAGAVLAPFLLSLFSVAVGIAVVRHRLLDVDVVISRTITYAALTAMLAAVYVVIVTLATAPLRDRHGYVPGLLASAVVAAVAGPLRATLQVGVQRLFFGRRDDPYSVVRRLGEALEASPGESLLEGLGSTIAAGLRLPAAEVLLDLPGQPPDDRVCVPLVHAGAQVGVLMLSPRGPNETFSPADERLLTDLARHAAAAAHGVRLTSALQAARAALVSSREEERRRLRRDLHDGLGPLLAAATMQLDAAQRLGPDGRVGDVLADVKREIQQAVGDVRRLVDDLRPAALDELGLVAAVRGAAERLCAVGPSVVVNGPERLDVPAAVEVAAFRIAGEAVTNAVRHADATRVEVNLYEDGDALVVEVRDDGRGGAMRTSGSVGLHSMVERAVELGGTTCVTTRPDGGTEVVARIPSVAS